MDTKYRLQIKIRILQYTKYALMLYKNIYIKNEKKKQNKNCFRDQT